MSRDLLEETIEDYKDRTPIADRIYNETGGAIMGAFPPSYSAGSCPEKAGDITINQTVIQLGAGDGAMKVDVLSIADFDITKKIATLSFTPYDSYPAEVEIKGVGQVPTTDYTIVGDTLTFIEALNDADIVIVRYAYEVV